MNMAEQTPCSLDPSSRFLATCVVILTGYLFMVSATDKPCKAHVHNHIGFYGGGQSIDSFHCAKPTIHQVTTMLATSKNVLLTGRNHLLTTGTDDPTF